MGASKDDAPNEDLALQLTLPGQQPRSNPVKDTKSIEDDIVRKQNFLLPQKTFKFFVQKYDILTL